ncbi:MAG: serine hydrolase [Solobacterium sp.]|nr:serine hydrolase [Solobacterium sp.]
MGNYVQTLDIHAEELLSKWNLQGFSIGIVKDGEVVLTKGYGKRNDTDPVDADTMMPIGSATKSFTALILGMLVDEGKLNWDTRVKEVIPSLKLYDDNVTEEVTVRDLLSHQTGVAAYDAQSIYPVPEQRSDLVPMLEYLEAQYPFRQGFRYSNQMVALAGHVAEVITGSSWEDLVKERILTPLGMTNTVFTVSDMEQVENRSLGYIATPQGNLAQPYLSLKSIAPAGGINSTVSDMVKYVSFQLGDGTWNGARLVSEASLEEMHKTQVNGSPYLFSLPEVTDTTYGLGWFVDQYRGVKMVSHGGNTLGFSAQMTLLPSEQLGVIVLTNGTTNFLTNAVVYQILDDYLGVEETDWTASLNAVLGPLFAGMAAGMEAKEAARVKDTVPSLPLTSYAGVYVSKGFGTITVKEQDGQLSILWNDYQGILTHYNYDIFDAAMFVYGVQFPATFLIEDGEVKGFHAVIEPTPGISPVFFEKQ